MIMFRVCLKEEINSPTPISCDIDDLNDNSNVSFNDFEELKHLKGNSSQYFKSKAQEERKKYRKRNKLPGSISNFSIT